MTTLDDLKAALAHQTYFILWAYWPGNNERRLDTVETHQLRTEDEVIAALADHPNVVLVHRSDYDSPRRDVTEDIARKWWRQLAHDDAWPPLVEDQLGPRGGTL